MIITTKNQLLEVTMFEKLRQKAFTSTRAYWLFFLLQTVFYLAVMIMLVYLYKYLHISGGSFIYNEF